MIEVWLAFLAGLAGSPHCLGMCGGIVAALAVAERGGVPHAGQLFQLFYNLGRTTTYALLGVAAGLLGSSLDLLAVRSVAMWGFAAANLFVAVIGLATMFGISAFNLFTLEGSFGRFLAGPLRYALAGTSPLRAFPLGMLLGFLPCGLVYAPLVVAAGTGNPLLGGAIMAALGLGTMPLLLFFGSASALLSARIKTRLFRLVGFFLTLMGVAGLWRLADKLLFPA